MKQIKTIKKLKETLSDTNQSIGLVPTMGALHEGHLKLIKESILGNERTVVSIFVNPTQFNQAEDFELYPSDLEGDLLLLENLGVDVVFTPDKDDLYPDSYNYRVSEINFSKILCGKDRPGHFDGVLTVILKLINLTEANNVYFGEKDYQQYKLIKEMINAFFIKTNIVAVPTVRERSGLALSSRNRRLSEEAIKQSPQIYKKLKSADKLSQIQNELEEKGFIIDYLEEIDGRRFIAAKIENVRLIDNVKI